MSSWLQFKAEPGLELGRHASFSTVPAWSHLSFGQHCFLELPEATVFPCISFLLLHRNSNLSSWNITCLLSHHFDGSGVRVRLSWSFAQGFTTLQLRCHPCCILILKLNCKRMCFQVHSSHWKNLVAYGCEIHGKFLLQWRSFLLLGVSQFWDGLVPLLKGSPY